MKPIPADVVARWGAMWAKDHHPEWPWWVRPMPDLDRDPEGYAPSYWTRCDGLTTKPYADNMEEIDAAHPLPAPGPMPGQVWAHSTGDRMVVGVEVIDGRILVGWGHTPGVALPADGPWPPPDHVLVAGPTPWGRDVPWGPA